MGIAGKYLQLLDRQFYKSYGKVSKVVGLTIESIGPKARLNDLCKIYVDKDMSKYVMTVENFTGAWVAAKDSDFNIPGFQDNISTEFTFAAGNWETQNTNGKVVMYKGEVVDLQNVLPENVRMICTIAYYNEQVCLARIYPVWEDIFGNEFSLNDLASIDVKRLSWPITKEKADIQKDIDYVKDTLSK